MELEQHNLLNEYARESIQATNSTNRNFFEKLSYMHTEEEMVEALSKVTR